MPAEGMMTKSRLLSFFIIISLFVSLGVVCALGKSDSASGSASSLSNELVVYAYDSFTADWGPGPELVKRFEAKTGYKVTMISCGDAAQVLSRAVLEKKAPASDVLIGIDNNLIDVARKEGVLVSYIPAAAASVSKELVLANDWLLTPYDWGYFAMIFDSASGIKPPASLEDLTKPEYAKKIILMDPRTSTPGTGFSCVDARRLWHPLCRLLDAPQGKYSDLGAGLGYRLWIVHFGRGSARYQLHDEPGVSCGVRQD